MVRIPIKRYEPNPEALRAMQTVLVSPYTKDDPIRMLAEELRDLLLHHSEETQFLLGHIKTLEGKTDE
jgi:hypothetical protein